MKHTISPDRKTLTITAAESEREYLRNAGEEIRSDDFMHDALEHITCNSELGWLNPEWTGDLTDAPMLGIAGEVDAAEIGFGKVPNGFYGNRQHSSPILERWAFLDYQVRSVLEDLRDKGSAVFIS